MDTLRNKCLNRLEAHNRLIVRAAQESIDDLTHEILLACDNGHRHIAQHFGSDYRVAKHVVKHFNKLGFKCKYEAQQETIILKV